MEPTLQGSLTLPTAYFPPIPYLAAILQRSALPPSGGTEGAASSTDIRIEQWETYQKQTLRNRCLIDSPNGPLALTIPVEHGGSRLIRDIRISSHGGWPRRHWQALVSTYAASPFFDFYADDFRPIYEAPPAFLIDFNQRILDTCLRLLGIHTSLSRTSSFLGPPVVPAAEETIPYYQVFTHQHGFLPGLSCADLLFCMGPEARLILRRLTLLLGKAQ